MCAKLDIVTKQRRLNINYELLMFELYVCPTVGELSIYVVADACIGTGGLLPSILILSSFTTILL